MIHIKLTIMALLWAGGFIAGKLIVQQAGPFTISFLRFLIATSVLAILVYKKEQYTKITLTHFVYAMCAGFLGIFCYNYLFFSGIQFVDAGRGSVIISTVPIVVAILSSVIFKEKMSAFKFFGILFSMFGAWVVVSHGEVLSLLHYSLGWGEIQLILCVFCAAGFALFSKQLLKDLSPMVTMVYISASGAAFLFGPALLELKQKPIDFNSITFYLNLLYLSIGPSVIAVTFYYEAIKLVGAARASQYMNLIPIFAVILAFIFLGEQITASLVIGGGLVTTGLYLANVTS